MATAEADRLDEDAAGGADWRRWGTYLSERAWGTVREDYSADGDAWAYFPFDHARSRAYRWNEDGLAGWCDRDQVLCLALALWNGVDPIVKERPFGLTNAEGNHGEDVKDYWFYTDNLPTHAFAEMTYKYPHAEFPYADLRARNAARGPGDGEYELFDALADDWAASRYVDVVVTYAKASPEDVIMRVTASNRGDTAAPIHLAPTVWYRNTWSWQEAADRPVIERISDSAVRTTHASLGDRWCFATATGPLGAVPVDLVFCENETNNALLFGSPNATATVKDGIGDYIVHGTEATVDRGRGSKAAFVVDATLAAGESVTVTVRFAPADLELPFADAEEVIAGRRRESDEFWTDLAASHLGSDERLVQRQALAGLLWCKQYYHYSVRRWLQGDPGQPTPPASRWTGRNADWQHVASHDVILMPDAWEYPWFAAWDLAFHCVAMAFIDPVFAKQQVLLLLSSVYQHPHGQIPAYEWSFGDTNPPVHAWATWQVYQLDLRRRGTGDRTFLAAAYRAITLDVVWWLNQKDAADRGVFGGGFLGMDNIGVFDRDAPLPTGGTLAQVDGTAWMGTLILQMLEMTIELAKEDPSYYRMFGRWVWDSWLIANALEKGVGNVSLWNESTGFYNDVIEMPDGSAQPLEVFSMQSLVPLFASIAVPKTARAEVDAILTQLRALVTAYDEPPNAVRLRIDGGDETHLLVAVVDEERLHRILERVLDPAQFLGPFGIRSLSAGHRDQPYVYESGGHHYSVRYTPAESENRMFGGNSNWRGPVWMPMNFLLVQSINTYARFFGSTLLVSDPSGGAETATLDDVADDIARRLAGIFLRGADGRRPVFGDNDVFQTDPYWRDLVPFHEYFDGDTGRGLGGSHQTGWTSLVALLLQFGGDLRFVTFT